MLLSCQEFCREYIPPNEIFDYGLWNVANKYVEMSDYEDETISILSDDIEYSIIPDIKAKPDQKKTQAIKDVALNLDGDGGMIKTKFDQLSHGKSTITAEAAGTLARTLMKVPSDSEIHELRSKCGDNVKFENFYEWYSGIIHKDDNVENLTQIFKVRDRKNLGNLMRFAFEDLLMSYGEPVSKETLHQVMSALQQNGEVINYSQFVEKLLESNKEYEKK